MSTTKTQTRISTDDVGWLYVDGERTGAHISVTESQVLRLILGRSSVVTRDQVMIELYGVDDWPETKILDVWMVRLRKKLGEHRGAIETVWGRGWVRNRAYILGEERFGMGLLSVDLDLADYLANALDQPPEKAVHAILCQARQDMEAE